MLLMAILLANIAQATENDFLLQLSSLSATMTGANPDCQSASSSIGAPAAEFGVFAPAPRQSTETEYCGSCSPSPCTGKVRYSICGYANDAYKRCDEKLAPSCPADLLPTCYCYSEDIP
jgi:hypothetical protein